MEANEPPGLDFDSYVEHMQAITYFAAKNILNTLNFYGIPCYVDTVEQVQEFILDDITTITGQ